MIRILFFILLIGNLLLAAWLMRAAPDDYKAPPPVAGDVERLVLLSERDETPPRLAARPRSAPGTELNCYSLGPFQTEADARAASRKIVGYVESMDIRSRQVETEIGNWVYISSLPNREAAQDVARRLAAANVEDYYIIGSGDEENTISLGLYREPGNAQRRVSRLQELGFNAEASARTETVPRYWIDYAVPAGDFAELESLLGAAAGLERETVACRSGREGAKIPPSGGRGPSPHSGSEWGEGGMYSLTSSSRQASR